MTTADVRNPETIEEACAAIDLVEAKIEDIEEQIERRGGTDPGWESRARAAITVWSVRLSELQHWHARLLAGDTPVSLEVARARAERDEALARLRAAQSPEDGRVAHLERELTESRQKVSRLGDEIHRLCESRQGMRGTVDDPRTVSRRQVWEELLRAEVAVLQGGDHAERLLRCAANGVPPEYRAAWNAEREARGWTPARSASELHAHNSELSAVAEALLGGPS